MSPQPARFLRSTATLERSVGADVLLALPAREEMELLSGTAVSVWHLLAAPRTPDELARRLGREFGAAPEDIRPDVDRLLRRLAHGGWIERVGEGDV